MTPFSVKYVAVIASVLLVGCASLSPTPDLQVPLAPRWQNEARLPISQAPIAGDMGEWWRSFQDPALDRLIQAALRSNLTIAAAREHLRAAQALVPVADTAMQPNLSAFTGSDSTPDARKNYFQATLGALWELPIFNRGDNARRAMASGANAAIADLAAAQVRVTSEVARGYFDALAAARSVALLHDLETLAGARLAKLSTRARIGLETSGEEQAVESELLALQSRSVELEFAQTKIVQRIAAILGETAADRKWIPARDAFPTYAQRLDSTPADMLRARPDVRHAQAQVMKAAADLGIARAELYPHLSLAGGITAATELNGTGGRATNVGLSAGPVLQIPLFDWGARRANADAHGAELAAAVFTYRQTVYDAVAEVEVALANVQRATELSEMQQRNVVLNEEITRRSSVSQRVGLKETPDFATAERAALEARLRLIAVQYAGAIAVVDLHEALGGTSLVPES